MSQTLGFRPPAATDAPPMIHPTAIIEPGARIGERAHIGPWCHIGPDVTIGDRARLMSPRRHRGPHQHRRRRRPVPLLHRRPRAARPQIQGEPTRCVIGARTQIREHCTINRGTITGTGVTTVGEDCLLMAVVHVAHDCDVGNSVVIANNVVMGGHVTIGERAVIGGAAALHQFVRIGRGAMIGGVSGVEADVIPFGSVIGNRAHLAGLNVIGLRRRGADRAGIHALRAAVRTLFAGDGVFIDRVASVRAEHGDHALVAEVLAFIDTPSKRGLIRAILPKDEAD